jgi:hypothetical protein
MQVIRATELPLPRQISDGDFNEICLAFGIGSDEWDGVRRHLDEIANGFAALNRCERGRVRAADCRAPAWPDDNSALAGRAVSRRWPAPSDIFEMT